MIGQGNGSTIESLREKIRQTEHHLHELRQQLRDAEDEQKTRAIPQSSDNTAAYPPHNFGGPWPLRQDEYARYGRQMIVQEVGLPGECQ